MIKKLLIANYKVDLGDGVFGFSIGWINQLAKRVESVLVICQSVGRVELHANVVHPYAINISKKLPARRILII